VETYGDETIAPFFVGQVVRDPSSLTAFRGDYTQYGSDTATSNYSVKFWPRGKLALAEKLVEKLEVMRPIPDDLNPTGYAPPILANPRHDFMIYHEVLAELNYFCTECI
jgi:hypothetical protein